MKIKTRQEKRDNGIFVEFFSLKNMEEIILYHVFHDNIAKKF